MERLTKCDPRPNALLTASYVEDMTAPESESTVPGTGRYRAIARTSWPGVSICDWVRLASLICLFSATLPGTGGEIPDFQLWRRTSYLH